MTALNRLTFLFLSLLLCHPLSLCLKYNILMLYRHLIYIETLCNSIPPFTLLPKQGSVQGQGDIN